jgi:hypothetical protein
LGKVQKYYEAVTEASSLSLSFHSAVDGVVLSEFSVSSPASCSWRDKDISNFDYVGMKHMLINEQNGGIKSILCAVDIFANRLVIITNKDLANTARKL